MSEYLAVFVMLLLQLIWADGLGEPGEWSKKRKCRSLNRALQFAKVVGRTRGRERLRWLKLKAAQRTPFIQDLSLRKMQSGMCLVRDGEPSKF